MDYLTTFFTPELVTALLGIFGSLLAVVMTALFNRMRKVTGLEIDAAQREALHGAIMRALASVAAKNTDVTSTTAISMALNAAQSRNPDTFRYFGLTKGDPRLIDLAAGMWSHVKTRTE